MDDLTTYALLATSFFFVAISFGLLVRYRQVSQKINASTDLGHDLWQSLEQRLNKQDERILDVMGRLEVIQSRVLSTMVANASSSPASPPVTQVLPSPVIVSEEKSSVATEIGPVAQQPESQVSSERSKPESKLDETQLAAMKLLSENPKDTRQLTDTLKLSREHTARVMKGLFEMGLVERDDSSKPFVYQLTDKGRGLLTSDQP
jgi:predicted transcriptional regulator